MLGLYESFPTATHGTTRFATSTSNRNLQQKLAETIYALNSQTLRLEKITDPSIPDCSVNFEFGIGETDGFNYLDEDEANKVLKAISRKPLQIMDFLCVVQYHKLQGERRSPLRFDYRLIRFTFAKNLMEVRVFHERGPMYTSPADTVNLIVNTINEGSSKKIVRETL